MTPDDAAEADVVEADVVEATEPAQLKALAHPLRNRILFAIGQEGATVSQLAKRLSSNKGNIAHHLMVLERAGLARADRTRTVRGGTERYWVRTSRRLRTPSGPQGADHTAALFGAVAQELATAVGEPLLHLRRVRLTRAQAQALSTHLERVIEGLDEAPVGEPTHGVLVSVFERPGRNGGR